MSKNRCQEFENNDESDNKEKGDCYINEKNTKELK